MEISLRTCRRTRSSGRRASSLSQTKVLSMASTSIPPTKAQCAKDRRSCQATVRATATARMELAKARIAALLINAFFYKKLAPRPGGRRQPYFETTGRIESMINRPILRKATKTARKQFWERKTPASDNHKPGNSKRQLILRFKSLGQDLLARDGERSQGRQTHAQEQQGH